MFHFLLVLTDREYVSVCILEPSDLVAAWGGPDFKFPILDERIFFEDYSPLREPADNGLDVAHFPPHNCVRSGGEILRLRDPDHGFAYSHHQGKLVVADKLESQLALIKSSRPLGVFGGNKAYEFA